MLKNRVRKFLGKGNKAIVVSVRELTVRMFGVTYTKKNIDSIDSVIRDLHRHGEVEKVERYSHLAGRVVNKYHLKGEHPRW